jgi:hypothetical protein
MIANFVVVTSEIIKAPWMKLADPAKSQFPAEADFGTFKIEIVRRAKLLVNDSSNAELFQEFFDDAL